MVGVTLREVVERVGANSQESEEPIRAACVAWLQGRNGWLAGCGKKREGGREKAHCIHLFIHILEEDEF